MKYFTLIVLLSTLTLNLSAQKSDQLMTNVGNATIIHTNEIKAAAKTDSVVAVEDAVLHVISIEGKYNVGVSVVTRSKINGKTPPDAIVHDLVTEVYHIIKGRGILVVGGSLDSPVRIPSDDPIVRKITGPSSASKSVIGGKQYEVGPGDIVVIPANTPHGFIVLKTKKIIYSLIRIDPEKVLELKN